MKKIYSLLALAAIGVSAFAAQSDEVNLKTSSEITQRTVKTTNVAAFPVQTNMAPVNQMVRGLRKLDNNPSIEGYWTFYLGDYYFNDSSQTYEYAEYEVTLEGTTLTFAPISTSSSTDKPFKSFVGEYDADNFTITFTRQYLNETTVGGAPAFVYQQPYRYSEELQDIEDIESFIGTFVPEENRIDFDIYLGLSWPCYREENPVDEKPFGFLAIYDFENAIAFTTTPYLRGEWQEIGFVTFMDGWLIPSMGLNQRLEQNQYQVLMEQSVENKYVYRLVNPYKEGPVAKYNGYEGDGYIVFDISDKNHVIFLPSDAGFLNYAILQNETGITNFYVYNQLGSAAVSYPEIPTDELVALLGESLPYTVFENGVVKLSYKYSNGKQVYDANFGYQTSPWGGNLWENANMSASITFPLWYDAGVGEIEFDENAPVEYFNLQGIKVNNPDNGQIVIKRQGTKAVKEIIK